MSYNPYAMPQFNVPNAPLKPQAPGLPGAPQAPQAGQNPYGLDPKVVEAMLGTYGDQLELGAQEKQLAQAQALRDQVAPEGRSSGRVYTAANPLEHLGVGIQRYKAMKKAEGIEGDMAERRRRIGENVKTYGSNIPK